METRNASANELKVGSYIMVDGKPCKVVDITKSKPGKHGAAKLRIDAMGLIDDRRSSVIHSSDGRVEVPIIEKKTAQIVSIEGTKASVMDTETFEMFELDIPEELKDKVKDGVQVIYWDMGVKQMKSLK